MNLARRTFGANSSLVTRLLPRASFRLVASHQQRFQSTDSSTRQVNTSASIAADDLSDDDIVESLGHPRLDAREAGKNSDKSDKDQGVVNVEYMQPHPIWSNAEMAAVEVTTHKPKNVSDWLAKSIVTLMRVGFDTLSGYNWRKTKDEGHWLRRIIFLETVAGIPGMVAAMVRHLHSLRRMQRDQGWIHTLLEEAENERMHLLTAMELRKPGPAFRAAVIATQAVFVPLWSIAYLASPKFCHRFVGYLEEQAVHTYTDCLKAIDAGELPMWSKMRAPKIGRKYWVMPDDATMRDLISQIRSDEAHHRDVNHTFATLPDSKPNPFGPGR